jgi:hypothetical protein
MWRSWRLFGALALHRPQISTLGISRDGEFATCVNWRRGYDFSFRRYAVDASLVGFITLFGIATRNGIILISHYSHLMTKEGVGFCDAIVQGSMERLSPILMTALVTGVGLIPLALGVGEPGKVIQQWQSILRGISTSTFLNMIVIPALYLKYGRTGAREPVHDYSPDRNLVLTAD